MVKAISTIARKVNVHKEIKIGSGYHILPPDNLKRLSNQAAPGLFLRVPEDHLKMQL